MRNQAGQQRDAPNHSNDRAQRKLQDVAIEEPSREQVGGVPEDNPAAADRVNVVGRG